MKNTNEITVEKFIAFEQIGFLRSEWKTFHESLKNTAIHSDFDWYCNTSSTFSSTNAPVVFTFRKNNELVGLVAGYYHQRTIAIKLGYFKLGKYKAAAFSTNYQCSIGIDDSNLIATMAETLQNELSGKARPIVYVNALRTEDVLSKSLVSMPLSKGLCLKYPPAPHMMMHLGKTLSETIDAKGSSVRAFLHRLINKNNRPNAQFHFSLRVYTQSEEIDQYYADAESIARKTYQWALGVGFQPTPFHRSQINLAAQKGCFRGNILYHKNIPVAFQEDYLCGTHCFNPYVGYDAAYSTHNPGTLLMLLAWDELIKNTQAKVYDFGYGEGLYKTRFSSICDTEGELLLFSWTLKNFVYFVLLSVELFIDTKIKQILNSLGIYESIKKYWRHRKAGIKTAKHH